MKNLFFERKQDRADYKTIVILRKNIMIYLITHHKKMNKAKKVYYHQMPLRRKEFSD